MGIERKPDHTAAGPTSPGSYLPCALGPGPLPRMGSQEGKTQGPGLTAAAGRGEFPSAPHCDKPCLGKPLSHAAFLGPPQELTPTPGSWQWWRDVGFPPRALRTGHRLISQRGWDHGQFWKYGRKGRAGIQTWFYVKLTQHHVHHLPRPTRTFWPPGWVVVECPRCCNLGLILLPEP